MSDPQQNISYVSQSFFKSLSGSLTDAELAKLEDILIHDETARQHYYDLVYVSTALRNTEGILALEEFLDFDMDLWQEMSEYEKTAPTTEVPKEETERESIPKVVYAPREKRKLSTFSKIFLVMNAAAILFIVLFLRFALPQGGVEVATLADSINARWADVDISMEKGTRLYNDKTPFLLREGFVEIKFDNNAQVTIEGPAEFQILDDDVIKLNYGQVYSQVPAEAYGFQICTQHAKIIDLGTEFGVKEDIDGDTEVHVLRGQVNLISNVLSKKINVNLLAGSAREFNAATGELKEIRCESNLFVRHIESNGNVVWKGQDIPLTNLLAGTLFDEVLGGVEINPATGEYVIHEDYVSGVDRSAAGDYHMMDSAFVDGTFIPQGPLAQTISSTDLTWQSPQTSGSLYYNLSDRRTIYDRYTKSYYPLSLTQAGLEKTSLLFHPNMGLTLDLDKIRQKIPTLHIRRFCADCGISYAMKEVLEKSSLDGGVLKKESSSMDFTILLDGNVCKTLTGINPDSGTIKIDVEIHPADRFLTLVSTDGDQHYEFDWFILADPVLVLK